MTQSEEHSLQRSRKGSFSSSSNNINDPPYEHSRSNSISFAGTRRPRRRAIDTYRELIVLVPGDLNDQMKKIGLTLSEIPEFA